MSNVITFPQAAGIRHVGASVLAQPASDAHLVQFYEEEEFLFETVAHFLEAGLRGGDRILVFATPAHTAGFVRRLGGLDVQGAIARGQLHLLDARETLSRFMVGDMPDPDLFRDVLARLIGKARGDEGRRVRIRAYGEMVDLLWRDGNSNAAIRLEEFWGDAGKEHSFSLLCAYLMGSFYKEGQAGRFLEVCRNHSHVMPTESFARLDEPEARLREISFLQQRAHSLESEVYHRKELEGALRDALRERTRIEEELRSSLRREKEARAQAEASDRFKEMFLGILGHDLRNPLNTILTTARLMTMRRELPPESERRLERVVVSGVRMQRMIEQLLDVARARLADGIPVDRSEVCDLAQLVTKIVDEIRAAHPAQPIELHTESCRAAVDPDRFEQVVSNLIGNAITHGEPGRTIRVEVALRGPFATVSVHNHGKPIAPSLMPQLFDPFKRASLGRAGAADGLGLGLYISERIVSAHGGKIEVESSAESGTRFEAIFPRP